LIMVANLVGVWHRQILRLLTVQDSIDIPGRAAELIGDASCI